MCQANIMPRVDKGLIPTQDDGPWHMLKRKGVL